MTITAVSLVDTFLSWMNKTNQVITVTNLSTEGQLNTSGTITITNASLVNGGVSLNVANGQIKGDGGSLTNVTPTLANSSIPNVKLANSYIKLISNSATLTVTGGQNANLGSTVYLDIGTLSIRANDASVSNIASAFTVNGAYLLAVSAFAQANSGVTAGPAFDKANSANVLAAQAYGQANAAYSTANIAAVNIGPAYDKANAANVLARSAYINANSAFDQANLMVLLSASSHTTNTINARGSSSLTLYSGDSGTYINIAPSSGANTIDFHAGSLTKNGVVMGAGKQTLWIPAASFSPRIASGCAINQVSTVTNAINYRTLDFDAATAEYAETTIRMPKSWNEGTITFTPTWSQLTTSAGAVVWGFQAAAISSGDVIDLAYASVTVTSTGGTANTLYIPAESGSLTVSGTPAEGDMLALCIYRDGASGSDTLGIDARLHGINMFFTTNTDTDA